jgi:hypothetical protein
MIITQLADRNPNFFYSEDGAVICAAMNKIGVTSWCCRIKAIAQSQLIVYGVTVPRVYQSDRNHIVGVNVTTKGFTYAVKIIRDDYIFQKESRALKKIAMVAGPNSNFYALGSVPASGVPEWFCTIVEWEKGFQFKGSGHYWWDRSFDTVTKKGGTIIMRCGDLSAQAFDPKVALPKNTWADLINSLDLAHKAGILQCDLRRSNFVRFNDSWQLVDYSLSCEANSENPDEMEPGAQLECAGIGVRNLHNTNGPIYWTRIDD